MRHIRCTQLEILNRLSIHSTDEPLIVNLVSDCFTIYEPYSYDTYNCQGRDDYFLIYVTDGIFSTEIDGITYNLKKGSVVLFPPKYKYHYWGKPPSQYLCAHFTGSRAEKILTDLGFSLEPHVLEGEFSPKIKSLFDKMAEQFLTKAPFLQYSLACLLSEILLTIATNRVRNDGYRTLKKSIKYIHENFTERIEVPELAKMEGLSNSRYIALFTEEMEKTPREYILDVRLGRACELLVSTDIPVGHVGTLSGYRDQYFFSKIFKKHLGMSPCDYRKQHR